MSDAAAIALNDLADQVAGAADLDSSARRDVAFDIEVGDPEFAIYDALLATRKPLQKELLDRIRKGVDAGWYDGPMRRAVVDAIGQQQRQNDTSAGSM